MTLPSLPLLSDSLPRQPVRHKMAEIWPYPPSDTVDVVSGPDKRFLDRLPGIGRWALSPISVISDIGMSLISERPISD